MTELSASFAPRKKMKSNFLPFTPIPACASARRANGGTFRSEARPRPAPAFNDRSKKVRRERRFRLAILLFVKALQAEQQCHHPAHTRVIGGIGDVAHGELIKLRRG